MSEGVFEVRKLGIIGGTSWSSTALYYEHINRGVARRLGGLHSGRLTIESIDFAEMEAMQRAGDWDAIAQLYVEAGKRLVAAGAEGMLMACNTTHKIYDKLADAAAIPVIHIGDAVADRLAADRRKPGRGPRHPVHDDRAVHPVADRGARDADRPVDEAWIAEVDRIIFEELAVGRVVRDSQRKLKTLITELAKQRVQAVVLACTELVLAVDVRANVIPVYDTTAIHAARGGRVDAC